MAPDLVAAMIERIRDQCGALLGDTPTTPKIFADYAGPVAMPYVSLFEIDETDAYQSWSRDQVITYVVDGTIQVSIFARVRLQSRDLGRAIETCLIDAPLEFADGELLEMRSLSKLFQVESDLGPDAPTIYHRILTFHYAIQRAVA